MAIFPFQVIGLIEYFPYEFIGFAGLDDDFPSEFIGFGTMD